MLRLLQMLLLPCPQETACKVGPFALVQGAGHGDSFPKQKQLCLPPDVELSYCFSPHPLHSRDHRL